MHVRERQSPSIYAYESQKEHTNATVGLKLKTFLWFFVVSYKRKEHRYMYILQSI